MKLETRKQSYRPFELKVKHLRIICAAVLLLSSCAKQESPPPTTPPPVVSVETMKSGEITVTRELPGRTVASLVAEVRPRVSGIVEERLFEEGGPVKENQPLYRLDDTMYKTNYNEAKASLKTTQAAVTLARADAERATQLFSAGLISKQQYDSSIASSEQADARMSAAKASFESARVVLNYCRILSPIRGIISRSAVTKGALVTADQTEPLAVVQQLDPMFVDISQSSRALLELRRDVAGGDLKTANIPVTIRLEDGSTYEHPGEIAFAEATVDKSTGSYTLRIIVANPDGVLLPGMYVRATIGAGVRENGMLVPQRAVLRAPDGSTTVMVVRPDTTVESRAVALDRSVENSWLVKNGLVEGDRIVTDGLQKVRAGQKVEIDKIKLPDASVGAPK